jgi:hypothetical protein
MFSSCLPQKHEKQKQNLGLPWMTNFDHPLLIHFNVFFNIFLCTWFIWCYNNFTNFFIKWRMKSWSKSPKPCNYEGCLKLETPKFHEWWQFFISQNIQLEVLHNFTKLNFLKSNILCDFKMCLWWLIHFFGMWQCWSNVN